MARAVNTETLDQDTVREALEFIAQGLRPADLAEMQALQGSNMQDPFWALFESVEASAVSWLILDASGLPIGVFGAAPHLVPGVGIAWLMGTDGMERGALSIARQSVGFMEQMHRYFPILWADVDARNELSMRWLEWAGFALSDATLETGAERRLFLQFVRTSDV